MSWMRLYKSAPPDGSDRSVIPVVPVLRLSALSSSSTAGRKLHLASIGAARPHSRRIARAVPQVAKAGLLRKRCRARLVHGTAHPLTRHHRRRDAASIATHARLRSTSATAPGTLDRTVSQTVDAALCVTGGAFPLRVRPTAGH